MAPPLLLLQDIALTFGGRPLLEVAGLSVPAGERLCLVGRNGSGKSTLLRIAAASSSQTAGRVSCSLGSTCVICHRSPIFPATATRAPMWTRALLAQLAIRVAQRRF
jgi:ABC transport system ATP-binding/permease protein